MLGKKTNIESKKAQDENISLVNKNIEKFDTDIDSPEKNIIREPHCLIPFVHRIRNKKIKKSIVKKFYPIFNKNNNKNDIINLESLNNVYGADNDKINSLTKRLVETCNNILVSNEDNCQCYDNNKYPSRNHHACSRKKKTKKCKCK